MWSGQQVILRKAIDWLLVEKNEKVWSQYNVGKWFICERDDDIVCLVLSLPKDDWLW